jgi:hypothetical protein
MRALTLIVAFSFALPVTADTGMSVDPVATKLRGEWAAEIDVNRAIKRLARERERLHPFTWEQFMLRIKKTHPYFHYRLTLETADHP